MRAEDGLQLNRPFSVVVFLDHLYRPGGRHGIPAIDHERHNRIGVVGHSYFDRSGVFGPGSGQAKHQVAHVVQPLRDQMDVDAAGHHLHALFQRTRMKPPVLVVAAALARRMSNQQKVRPAGDAPGIQKLHVPTRPLQNGSQHQSQHQRGNLYQQGEQHEQPKYDEHSQRERRHEAGVVAVLPDEAAKVELFVVILAVAHRPFSAARGE
mmetsp:Transcript_14776/g.23283  ORF Transcript_14776/g.23283 Transcript_14776/m.23283 type:complete len:209 (+) Transcript_14776:1761-2387(+)